MDGYKPLTVGSTPVGTAAGVKKGVCCTSINFDCNEVGRRRLTLSNPR